MLAQPPYRLQSSAAALAGRALQPCCRACLEQATDHRSQCKTPRTCLFYHLHISLMILLSCRENAGLIAMSRVGSRRVVQISAGFMIFFSVLGNLFSHISEFLSIKIRNVTTQMFDRQIWSSFCFHSNAYCGCFLLRFLWLFWYVFTTSKTA